MTRILIAIIALLFAGCQTSASAGWPHDAFDTYHAPAPRTPVHVHKHRPRVIYRNVKKPALAASTSRCAAPLTREGDQYATQTGAMGEADKAWMQAVRWKWGEHLMDISHAENVSHSCGRSSIGSVAGQTFHRCEVTATPCRAPKVGE